MEITFMWKDQFSNLGDCAALYKAPGGYVVQGERVDAHTRAQLRDLSSNEEAVYVPRNVIDRIQDVP